MEALYLLVALCVAGLALFAARPRRGGKSVLSYYGTVRPEYDFEYGTLSGSFDGGEVAIREQKRFDRGRFLMEVRLTHPDWAGAILDRLEPGKLSPGFTGDDVFDDVVFADGGPELLVLLTPELRVAVGKAITSGSVFDSGRWTREGEHLATSRDQLRWWLELAGELACSAPDARSLAERLEERAQSETHPEVRRRLALARLDLPEPLSAERQAAWLARDDVLALVLARALGVRGQERLVQLTLDGADADIRWEALVFLRGSDDPRVAEALATFLDSDSYGTSAVQRLAEAGTVDQIPALREVAERWLDGRQATAEQAIRAIQARARGDVGAVSVADASGGGLAVADSQDAGRERLRKEQASRQRQRAVNPQDRSKP